MNVLIFEYITGGGLIGEVLPASLVKEGELMLNAIARDFAELSDVQVSVLRDYRLQSSRFDYEHVVNHESNISTMISSMEASIDALLIIAPETNAVLSYLCEIYASYDFILLNSPHRSVALVSDKLKTFNYLQDYNIPQIASYALDHVHDIHDGITENIDTKLIAKRVIKPKDGVACENIRVLASNDSIENVLETKDLNNYLVQPYVHGQSASLSLLCWQGECLLLSVNIQTIEEDENNFELKQCIVNALERDKFYEFSKNLIKALPELRGYIGVDIIITEKGVLLVEVNPRLTISYVGLKSAIGINPANLILQTFIDEKLPQVDLISGQTVTVEVGEDRAA